MRCERRFGLPAFGLILARGLVFLSLALLASGAQKQMLLMRGARLRCSSVRGWRCAGRVAISTGPDCDSCGLRRFSV